LTLPSQPEVRTLINATLDKLIPILPQRSPPTPSSSSSSSSSTPLWIREFSSALAKESQQATGLAHVYHVMVRHPDVFYPHRFLFIESMATSVLGRFGTPQNRPAEIRRLSLDMAQLIINWDKRALEAQKYVEICIDAFKSLHFHVSFDSCDSGLSERELLCFLLTHLPPPCTLMRYARF
jgi:transformation/transcription domain-associated protein